jgi:nicotinamidase-related amidase
VTVTRIDQKTALLVVDLQKALINLKTIHPMDDIVRNAALLSDFFREKQLPVVVITVEGRAPGRTEAVRAPFNYGDDGTEPHPLLNHSSKDIRVTKRTWGAFTETGLADQLRLAGITQVVIAGIVTSMGVESTARQAHDLGFNVTIALDAITDIEEEAHLHSTTLFRKLGETGTVSDIINKMS